MTHSNANAASFLQDNLDLILDLRIENSVLDLACGKGRNGLFLVGHNVPVTFADNSEANLQLIQPQLDTASASAQRSEYCLVDFEAENEEGCHPLAGKIFDAVLVFNYLHRPLFPFIKQAIRPGGLIVYETFTVDQPQFGRPNNPDYLLHSGELLQAFDGWQILNSFEGELAEPQRAKARLIARKPSQ
jgi:tellurite methyltransferase